MEKNNNTRTPKDYKSVKVAIFCIFAGLIFYFGATFLKGINILGHKRYFYAVFEDVGALHESTNVNLNGYQIGKVTDISMLSSNPVRICAEILVTEKFDIPKDSWFEVAQKDVLGGMVVNLRLGESREYAQKGDTLASSLSAGMLDGVGDLVAQLRSVVASVDTIGMNLKTAFLPYDSVNGGTMIKNTLENLQNTTGALAGIISKNDEKFTEIVTQLDRLSKTLGEATPRIESIVANIDNITDSVAQANIKTLVGSAQKTIDNANHIISGVDSGQGTVGQLMHNDALYKNIEKTIESLNILIEDIKANPSKYINVTVFGKKEKTKKQ
ncbi:MAG: MlaD family protein [Bacteroidales bacterium]|nr:MlaD family protein [Bacteroidales bacterium]MDY6347450.1 MlaD family protein [Bacteroidales bacterium]